MAQTLIALTESARFEAAMGRRPCARSQHFSVHYLGEQELSTGRQVASAEDVDDPPPAGLGQVLRLGMVVPKRHARRSVTRNLLKRQIRARVHERLADLPGGAWVLRLRAPFDRQQFPSAASAALGSAVRAELEGLLVEARRRAARGDARGPGPGGVRAAVAIEVGAAR